MASMKQRLRRGAALAIVGGVLAAPVASAKPIDAPDGWTHPDYPNLAPTEVVTAEGEGFDWGDAGIGAGAVVAIGALAAGTGVAGDRMSREGAVSPRAR
jgi:hypothetical protein